MESCFGSTLTAPQDTYWRSSSESTNYIPCLNPDACKAGDSSSPTGICKEGYDGVLCANCKENYTKSSFECYECPSEAASIVLFLFLILILISVIIFMVKVNLKVTEAEQLKRPISSVYVKIFFNHY